MVAEKDEEESVSKTMTIKVQTSYCLQGWWEKDENVVWMFNDPLITDVYGLIFLLDFGVIDISHYILRHWICPCCLVVLVFVYSSSLNVQEYMVTISNKIIEDAVKAVREDCSMENIKWVDNIFYWFTWCEFECWFFRRLAETIKKYRPESMEVKNVRKLWSFWNDRLFIQDQ